jgi:hypothetical protein
MYPQSKGLPALPKRLKKYFTPHTKTAPLSVNSIGMLSMGESADGVLPEGALSLAANRTSCLMTLSTAIRKYGDVLIRPLR